MNKQIKLLTILRSLPPRYTPLEQLAGTLAREHVVSIRKPYKGKHPHNPRYVHQTA